MDADDRQFVRSMIGKFSGKALTGQWVADDRFPDVVMRVCAAEELQELWPRLVELFAGGFDEDSLSSADHEVRHLVDSMGGLRGDQYVFVSTSMGRRRAFLAIWPWQNAPQASLRLGFMGIKAFDLSLFDELLKQ